MRGGFVVAVLLAVMATTAAALTPAAEAKRLRPAATLKGATSVTVGGAVRFKLRGRAGKGRRITRYVLRFGDGSSPRRGRQIPRRRIAHVYRRAGVFLARLTVIDNRKRRASARLRIVVHGPPLPGPPQLPQPLMLRTAALELAPGSTARPALPAPLVSITRLEPLRGVPAHLSVLATDGGLVVSARAGTAPQKMTVVVTGRGCTATACNRMFNLQVPVTVRGLAAPPGYLEHFTAASPDRIAAATPLAGGGVVLRDELVITLGTPDSPGSRADADDIADIVGAVVSGGIDDLGVFELRWSSPQDIEERRTELEDLGVTSVSDSTLGVRSADAEPPGDWSDDGPQATWPFTVTRARQAWDKTKGSQVTVGVVDTGQVFGGHEDLNVTKKIGGNSAGQHATHVAGTACAKANGKGLVGFAWGCPIVTAGWNDGTDKGELEAATAVAKAGARVVNTSLGVNSVGCASAALQEKAIAMASDWKAEFRQLLRGPIGRDVIWTYSAGNNCAAGVPSPGGLNSDLGNVIAVAAINSDGQLASFSDFGAGVEIAAPGGLSVPPYGNGTVGIWSTWVNSCFGLFKCGSYSATDPDGDPIVGTSMAAPAVAGIAALVRARHPEYGASRAAGCITGSAGVTVGSVTSRSNLPLSKVPQVDFTGTIPIVNAEAAVDCNALVFDGSPGTGPPPSTLGPYTMTAFGPDSRATGQLVSDVTDPAGTLGFTPSLNHRRVPSSWATWSHGYTGDVYFAQSTGGDPTVEITLPAGTKAFAFYAEPNTFASFTVEAIAQDGTSSEPVTVEGRAGARYFGFYGTGGQTVASITVSAADPAGFAVGEFSISR
jgi:subtilisin family serine protease